MGPRQNLETSRDEEPASRGSPTVCDGALVDHSLISPYDTRDN